MSSAPWSPGFRRRPTGAKNVAETMRAIAYFYGLTVRVFSNKDDKKIVSEVDDDTVTETGDGVVLSIKGASKNFGIDLSRLTEEELNTFAQVFMIAIETARPIIQERDKIAREGVESGQVQFERSFRSPPRLTRFDRTE